MSSAPPETLGELSTKFESLLEGMQTPAAKKGMEAASTPLPRSSAGRPPRRRAEMLIYAWLADMVNGTEPEPEAGK